MGYALYYIEFTYFPRKWTYLLLLGQIYVDLRYFCFILFEWVFIWLNISFLDFSACVVDHCHDLNGTDSGRREDDFLEELSERTHERTVVTSKSQSMEALERNNEHKMFLTSQNDSC